MAEEKYIAIKRAAQGALLKLSGVHAVGVGFRRVNGRLTDEVVIAVSVDKKKPLDELAPEEIVPSEIDGVKTDVVEEERPVLQTDTKEYRPLKGGVQIESDGGSDAGTTKTSDGTLGCEAQTVDDNTTVLLTNAHVLAGIKTGEEVYQPVKESNCSNCCPTAVAKKLKAVNNEKVDAAIAKIVKDVKIKPTIVDIGDVAGTNVYVEGESVRKRGARTGLTSGIVSHWNVTGLSATDTPYDEQLKIVPAGSERFSNEGDSGSVIVNESNEVIGLLWGGSPNGDYSMANEIQNVMDALGIKIVAADPSEAPAEEEVVMTDRQNLVAAVLSDLRQTEQGRRYLEYYFRHHAEIRQLVNTNRRVATAWHRNHGPVVFRSVISLAQDRESILPEEIEGRALALCLDGILGAFLKYGSPALKKDIIMESLDASGLGGLSYEQLLERLGTSSRV
jgi:hypothetical protein